MFKINQAAAGINAVNFSFLQEFYVLAGVLIGMNKVKLFFFKDAGQIRGKLSFVITRAGFLSDQGDLAILVFLA